MVKSPNKKKNLKRRLAISRPSLFKRSKKNIKKTQTTKKNSRAVKKYFRYSRRKYLNITYRKFRTNKQRRSKHTKQFVVKLLFSRHGFREVSFQTIKLTPAKLSQAKQKSQLLGPQAVLSPILLLIGVLGIVFFGLQATQSKDISLPEQTISIPTPAVKKEVKKETAQNVLPKSEPKSIKIPRVGIDSVVMNVGLLPDGSMETPPIHSGITGWYKNGPTPGELGPSIIVGHVDTYKGPSVFWRLRDLVPGDIVEITRADNKVAKFKVDSLEQFDQANFPTDKVYGNIPNAGLRLITCGGTFNHKTGHYNRNTVVFATYVKG